MLLRKLSAFKSSHSTRVDRFDIGIVPFLLVALLPAPKQLHELLVPIMFLEWNFFVN